MKIGDSFNPYRLFNGVFIPFSLMEYQEITSTAKLLYGRLSAYAGENGFAYPKQETLAKELGLTSRGSITRALKELIDNKFIKVTKPQGKEKIFHKCDRYEFLWHQALEDSLKKTENTGSTARVCTMSDSEHPDDAIVSSGRRHRVIRPTPQCHPDDAIVSSGRRHSVAVYKDEKNHIEKNHKEIKKSTSNEVLKENMKFSFSPSEKKPIQQKKEKEKQCLAKVEEFKLTSELLAWGSKQPNAWTADEMQIHYEFYLDYLENIPIAKRKKNLAAQFRNAVRGNWANIRRVNLVKSWQDDANERTERAKQNVLKMMEGNDGNAEIGYFD